ncbi:MAG: hypothetical protein AAGF11_38235 [Myxococcota bacterium]
MALLMAVLPLGSQVIHPLWIEGRCLGRMKIHAIKRERLQLDFAVLMGDEAPDGGVLMLPSGAPVKAGGHEPGLLFAHAPTCTVGCEKSHRKLGGWLGI